MFRLKNRIVLVSFLIVMISSMLSSIAAGEVYVVSLGYSGSQLTYYGMSMKAEDFPAEQAGSLTALLKDDKGNILQTKSFEPVYGGFELYLPFEPSAARLSIHNGSGIMLEVQLTQFTDTCGDGICEDYESFGSCREDCKSGMQDNFCDEARDDICDPDCQGMDPDCKVQNNTEPSVPQIIIPDEPYVAVKKETKDEKDILTYLTFIAIIIAFSVVVILLAELKRKDNKTELAIIYADGYHKEGYPLARIKDQLFKLGFNEKQVDSAIRNIKGSR